MTLSVFPLLGEGTTFINTYWVHDEKALVEFSPAELNSGSFGQLNKIIKHTIKSITNF